jgi:DNA polymerase III delta subunit
MDIKQLKKNIESKDLDTLSMIWQIENESSKIIVDLYIKEICKFTHLSKKIISSFSDIPDTSFIVDDNLYVIYLDKFNDTLKYDNCIVVCNSTTNKDVIKIPKLLDWQIIDYVMPKVNGIEKVDLEWLLSNYSGNYFRFINDIEKLSIFPTSTQKIFFNQMVDEGVFDTISSLTVFDLSNAIIKKDTKLIREVLNVKDYIDLTPMHFLTILINNFKRLIDIQLNPRSTPESLEMSEKQFYVIKKYNCGYYNEKQLIKIYDILINIEYMFKFKELDIDDIIDYIIVKILEV